MKKIKQLCKKCLTNKEIISYLIVGVMTTVISLLSYYLLTEFILNPKDALELQIANVSSWIICVTFAYIANRKFVFYSKETSIVKECIKFYLARLSTLLIDMFSMFCLVSLLNLNDRLSKIIVQFLVLILNYVFSKFLVFKSKK